MNQSPILRIGRRVITASQSTPGSKENQLIFTVEGQLKADRLDKLLDQLPRNSTLVYDGREFHQYGLNVARNARNDFYEAQKIASDRSRPPHERLAAGTVMGHKRGIWYEAFGSPFNIGFQEVLVVNNAVLRDPEICKAIADGFKEQLMGVDSGHTILAPYHCAAVRNLDNILADDTCTFFECYLFGRQRQLAKSMKARARKKTRARKSPSKKSGKT